MSNQIFIKYNDYFGYDDVEDWEIEDFLESLSCEVTPLNLSKNILTKYNNFVGIDDMTEKDILEFITYYNQNFLNNFLNYLKEELEEDFHKIKIISFDSFIQKKKEYKYVYDYLLNFVIWCNEEIKINFKDFFQKKDINLENSIKKYIEKELKVESDSVHNILIRIIKQQKQKEEKHDIWKNSPYKDLVKLQINNVGNVGEELLNKICKSTNIPAVCDGSKTKQIGGGKGDGKIMDIPVEIKTAHQGSTSPSFQHELGEVPWKGSKYMIFVDISPECIYLTIFKNFDEATYKSKEKLPCFPTKTITWRKEKGAFKLDTSVKINEQSIKNGLAIKITPTTSNDFIASFIRKTIV